MSEASWLRRVVGGGLLGTLFGAGTYGVLSYADLDMLTPTLEYALSGVVGVGTMISAAIGDLARDFWAHWRPRISGALIESSERAISRPRRRYLERLERRVRDLVVKGLKVQNPFAFGLHKMFVELRLDERAPQDVSSDLLGPPQRQLDSGSHEIWEFLDQGRNLVILGRPGAGKSTLLAHIVITLCRSRGAITWPGPYRLPILLYLREHVSAIISEGPPNLAQIVASTVPDERPVIEASFFDHLLRKGDCLVLLDGLDEVADPGDRLAVSEWVEKQIEIYGHSRFIVTSRPTGYKYNPLKGMDVLRICPFNQGQIESFLERWYVASEARRRGRREQDVKEEAQRQSEDLYLRLNGSPELMEMASNPMLLTMMALIHIHQGTLPKSKRSVYEEICSHFLGGRDDVKHIKRDILPEQRRLVLEQLAFEMMKLGKRELNVEDCRPLIEPVLESVTSKLSVREFLYAMESDSGLLREQAPNIFGFTHKSLQEYLCAHHVVRQPSLETIEPFVLDDYWRESVLLLAEMRDITLLVKPLLDGSPPSLDALALAYAIEGRALQLDPALRSRLDEFLRQALSSPDPERRRLAVEVRIVNRVRDMIPLREGVWVDTRLISEAEYGLFMEERRKLGDERYPDHWGPEDFVRRLGDEAILDVRREDALAFCGWLSARSEKGEIFRLLDYDSDWSAASTLPLPGLTHGHSDCGFLMSKGETAINRVCLKIYPQIDTIAPARLADDVINVDLSPSSWVFRGLMNLGRDPAKPHPAYKQLTDFDYSQISSESAVRLTNRLRSILEHPATIHLMDAIALVVRLSFNLLKVLFWLPRKIATLLRGERRSLASSLLERVAKRIVRYLAQQFLIALRRRINAANSSDSKAERSKGSSYTQGSLSPERPMTLRELKESENLFRQSSIGSFAHEIETQRPNSNHIPSPESLGGPNGISAYKFGTTSVGMLLNRGARRSLMSSLTITNEDWQDALRVLCWEGRLEIALTYISFHVSFLTYFTREVIRRSSLTLERNAKTPDMANHPLPELTSQQKKEVLKTVLHIFKVLPTHWLNLHYFEQKVIGNIRPSVGILIAKEYPTPKPRQSR